MCFKPTCCLLHRPERSIVSRKRSKSQPATRAGLCGQQPDSPEGKYTLENSRSCSLTALESFLILSALVVPVVFTGGCANLNILVTNGLDLQDNGLFFCVSKIYRTPRCLLEADKQMETRGGLYSSIIPYFL